MNTPLIEACVDSYASCRAAYRGGADRLELCAHLVIGGTTPSTALFRQVQRDIPVKTNILIRPRFGDFLYSKEELEQMCEEIQMYRELGANGVVIGALTPDGDLDLDAMRRLMNCAGNMDVTLHRAFDMTRDPFAAMEDAIRLGCKTILTSGQQKDPLTGAELLRELFEKADDRIDIMAGCGVKNGTFRRSTTKPASWSSTRPAARACWTAECATGSRLWRWACRRFRSMSSGKRTRRNSAPAHRSSTVLRRERDNETVRRRTAADGAAPRVSLRGDRRRGAKLAGAAAFGAFAGLCAADQMVLFRKSRQRLGQL